MASLLKYAKLAGVGVISAVIIWGFVQIRQIINERDNLKNEKAELIADQMPDTSKADTVYVIRDSIIIAQKDTLIHKLQSKLLRSARTPAETVAVETYITDTLQQAIDSVPCNKTIRGDYLYHSGGITAHIASLTDCRHDSVTYMIGSYYTPAKVTWGFDCINIAAAYWDKPHFAISAMFSTPYGISIGPALIDNAIGVNMAIRF
jgi:hypothetical protein